jgi:hypothetical protein
MRLFEGKLMLPKNVSLIFIEYCEPNDRFMSRLTTDVSYKLDDRYLVKYDGDITEFVRAEREHRVSNKYLHNVPALHVVLYNKNSNGVLNEHNAAYIRAAVLLKDEYNTIIIDISNMFYDEIVNTITNEIKKFVSELPIDKELNSFNELYKKGAEKYGLKVTVRDNQPYLENQMFMADFQYHNGLYETFEDKSMPDTLLYAAAYSNTETDTKNKTIDFQYPINSKILFRPEVKDYVKYISDSLTLLTTESHYLDDVAKMKNVTMFGKVFGDDYIKQLSRAKATIITNRELAHIEMMTARWYEAVLANTVIFVDKITDPQCKVLKQIHGNDKQLIDKLTVIPKKIVNSYIEVINDKELVKTILDRQHAWFNKLLSEIDTEKIKKDFA